MTWWWSRTALRSICGRSGLGSWRTSAPAPGGTGRRPTRTSGARWCAPCSPTAGPAASPSAAAPSRRPAPPRARARTPTAPAFVSWAPTPRCWRLTGSSSGWSSPLSRRWRRPRWRADGGLPVVPGPPRPDGRVSNPEAAGCVAPRTCRPLDVRAPLDMRAPRSAGCACRVAFRRMRVPRRHPSDVRAPPSREAGVGPLSCSVGRLREGLRPPTGPEDRRAAVSRDAEDMVLGLVREARPRRHERGRPARPAVAVALP